MPRRPLFLAFLLTAALTPPVFAAVSVPTNFVDEPIVTGLNLPRAFAFTPDGRIFVVEQKTATVHLIVNGVKVSPDPFTIPNVNTSGYERGLQGVAVDPGWPSRPYVYFYFNRTDNRNALVRYTVGGQVSFPTGTVLSFSNPLEIVSVADQDPNHQAGCLRFGPDGMLYLSLGEDELGCLAQDSSSFHGSILRLKTSALGSTAPSPVPYSSVTPVDNPIAAPDSSARLTWAYGMRNPWSFGMDPYTGRLYVADVGEQDEEELDEVLPGRNYGWPYREGSTTVLQRFDCPEPGGSGNNSNGYIKPIASYSRLVTDSRAIFSGGIYRPVVGGASNWPANYRGNVFWGDYFIGDLHRLQVDPNTGAWVEAPAVPGQTGATFATGFTSAVDFNVGPDASLWWLQQFSSGFTGINGVLHRIRYTGTPVTVEPRESTLSLGCAPNPVRSTTAFAFSLPTPGHATLALYDLSGRHVATLFDANAAAGESRLTWDGRDAHGTRLAPGLYLARLDAGSRRATTRVLTLP